MQLQADIMHIPVIKASFTETMALGAAIAGLQKGVNVWSLKPEDLSTIIMERFEPQIKAQKVKFVILHGRKL